MTSKICEILEILFLYNTEELPATEAHDQLYDLFSSCSKGKREGYWDKWEIKKIHNFASEEDRVFAVEVLDEVISDSNPDT